MKNQFIMTVTLRHKKCVLEQKYYIKSLLTKFTKVYPKFMDIKEFIQNFL